MQQENYISHCSRKCQDRSPSLGSIPTGDAEAKSRQGSQGLKRGISSPPSDSRFNITDETKAQDRPVGVFTRTLIHSAKPSQPSQPLPPHLARVSKPHRAQHFIHHCRALTLLLCAWSGSSSSTPPHSPTPSPQHRDSKVNLWYAGQHLPRPLCKTRATQLHGSTHLPS